MPSPFSFTESGLRIMWLLWAVLVSPDVSTVLLPLPGQEPIILGAACEPRAEVLWTYRAPDRRNTGHEEPPRLLLGWSFTTDSTATSTCERQRCQDMCHPSTWVRWKARGSTSSCSQCNIDPRVAYVEVVSSRTSQAAGKEPVFNSKASAHTK